MTTITTEPLYHVGDQVRIRGGQVGAAWEVMEVLSPTRYHPQIGYECRRLQHNKRGTRVVDQDRLERVP